MKLHQTYIRPITGRLEFKIEGNKRVYTCLLTEGIWREYRGVGVRHKFNEYIKDKKLIKMERNNEIKKIK